MSDESPLAARAAHFINMMSSSQEVPEELSRSYKWKENADGTWDFTNGIFRCYGHIIKVEYGGAYGSSTSISSHTLNLGDTVGVRPGTAWRVMADRKRPVFDTWGVTVGWYDNSENILVQVTGTIRGIGEGWDAGGRVYLPLNGYGPPQQAARSSATFPIGIALNDRDMYLLPRLDA